MNRRTVIFRKAAEQDLAEAFDWYFSIDPGLAERLLADFRLASDRVALRPLSCPIYLGNTRRTRLKVFPYFLYYRLEHGRVVVHGFLHTRRSPVLHRRKAK